MYTYSLKKRNLYFIELKEINFNHVELKFNKSN